MMGGRGASSGISDKQNQYGTQYKTVLTSGNIKFIERNSKDSEPLWETMTKGRVYVTVGGKDILHITYFNNINKHSKTIDFKHFHKGMKPHTHHGYEHNEYDGEKGAANLTPKEKRMVDRVEKIWYNYISRK